MFVPRAGAIVGGRFELTQVIGRGGMGEIWEARDTQLDSTCAVKFILQHLAHDSEIRSRFMREAKAIAQMKSPHAVHILGVGAEEQVLYLAMELLHGETLQTRLLRDGPLSQEATLRLVEQVADALERAHAAGIVHRDLKPDNIWLWSGKKLFVKVLDFGVAKFKMSTASLHTATGSLVGTPYYMSPEQARGVRELDSRSDLWSLAVIAIECLTCQRPFESEGLGDLLMQIVVGPIPPLKKLGPELPPSLQGWWERALARDPEHRFQTATELVEELRLHLNARGGPASLRSISEAPPPPSSVHGTLQPVQSVTIPHLPAPRPAPSNVARWTALSSGALVLVLAIVFGSRALRSSGEPAAAAPFEPAAVLPAPAPAPAAPAPAATEGAAVSTAAAAPAPPPAVTSKPVADIVPTPSAAGESEPMRQAVITITPPAATSAATATPPAAAQFESGAEGTAAVKARASTQQRPELGKATPAAPPAAIPPAAAPSGNKPTAPRKSAAERLGLE
jgi:eukaryotic-like serine/threonine-protein kinase